MGYSLNLRSFLILNQSPGWVSCFVKYIFRAKVSLFFRRKNMEKYEKKNKKLFYIFYLCFLCVYFLFLCVYFSTLQIRLMSSSAVVLIVNGKLKSFINILKAIANNYIYKTQFSLHLLHIYFQSIFSRSKNPKKVTWIRSRAFLLLLIFSVVFYFSLSLLSSIIEIIVSSK